jgi:hypothetical protein
MPFSKTMVNLIERYNLNIIDLPYALSNYARKHSNESYMHEIVNEAIVSLLKITDLKINFFAINKNGRYIYKNNIYQETVGIVPYVTDSKAWEISLDIMKKRKQMVIEEKSPKGNVYLSVKAPLIVKEKVEGVIGLSIDITDRKKKEDIENKLKIKIGNVQEARELAHDISSPIIN